MKARILCVSYDEVLLRTRAMLLQHEGYGVVSSLGFTNSLRHCNEGGFDLFVLGHSIPIPDQEELTRVFKKSCKGPVVSLRRGIGQAPLSGADVTIDPEPEELLRIVSRLLRRKE